MSHPSVWPKQLTLSHFICTWISENQGLEKLRSVSNLRKISGPAKLNFFSVHLRFFFSLSPGFLLDLWYKSERNSGDKLKKKLRCTEKKFSFSGPEIFLRFETELNLSRPWFSEIKVQIKWLTIWPHKDPQQWNGMVLSLDYSPEMEDMEMVFCYRN